MTKRQILWLRILVHVVSLVPLVMLLWAAWQRQLGPDPIGEATRRAGRYAITWLLLALLPTAVKVVTGWPGLMRVRRALGLYAFMYAAIHLSVYVGIDYAFALGLVAKELRRSPFILAGLAALLVLVPLAVTSTDAWVRRLRRNWVRLHRLVYLAGALALLHYLWNYKELRREPLLAGSAFFVMLLLRMPFVAGLFGKLRQRKGG